MTCYTAQFSAGNLSRNGIARQVAEKIVQCNRILKTVVHGHSALSVSKVYTVVYFVLSKYKVFCLLALIFLIN